MAELNIRLPDGLRQAGQADWRVIGDITGDAFRDDELSLWVFGNTRAMRPIFGREARHIYLPRGICHIAGDMGSTMWLPPGPNTDLPLLGTLDIAFHMMRLAGLGALRRGMALEAAMERRRPKTPHVYLFNIAVRQSAQGKGVGRTLLAPMLDACDRAGLPAYLENSKPRNHSFYVGHGFEHMEHFAPAPDAPPLEMMWREPR